MLLLCNYYTLRDPFDSMSEHDPNPRIALENILRAQHKAAVLGHFAACGFVNVADTDEGFERTAVLIDEGKGSVKDEVGWRTVVYDGELESSKNTPKPVYPVRLLGAKGISLIDQSTLGYMLTYRIGASVMEGVHAPVRSLSISLNRDKDGGTQALNLRNTDDAIVLLAPDMPVAAFHYDDYDYACKASDTYLCDDDTRVIGLIQRTRGRDAVTFMDDATTMGLFEALDTASYAILTVA